jgi:DNA-binding transcriptional LysR family regulator
MSDLRNLELRRLDLTLLLIFLGLLKYRKAARVAAEFGLTQSAISQALKRLRDIFGDELFLRRPHGLEPTTLALSLEAPILDAVETLRQVIGKPQGFTPLTASGVIRIAALDAEQAVLIPVFADRLRRAAPGLQMSILPLGRQDAVNALAEGLIDLAIGFIWSVPANILQQKLYDEDFRVAGLGHRFSAGAVTLEAYCEAPHILVSPGGDLRGIVDDTLAKLGRKRTIALALPSFLPALAAAAATDALVTLPSRIATTFAGRFGMEVAQPPLAVRTFTISMFWHARDDQAPRSLWLRSVLAEAATRGAMAGPPIRTGKA